MGATVTVGGLAAVFAVIVVLFIAGSILMDYVGSINWDL